MATPFLYYGQDSGTLTGYYSKVLLGYQGVNSYVILRGSDGNPFLVYADPLIQGYAPQEQTIYSVNLSGDFFGDFDDTVYEAKLKSGEVQSAYNDVGYLKIIPSGIVTGIPLDLPKIVLSLSGIIESGLNEFSKYDIALNSGLITGILYDQPVYDFVINSGIVTGIQIDYPVYNFSVSGKVQPIYPQKEQINFNFFSGSIGRGAVLFYIRGADAMNLGFNFSDGAVGGAD
mgnify:FL=1